MIEEFAKPCWAPFFFPCINVTWCYNGEREKKKNRSKWETKQFNEQKTVTTCVN